MFDKNTCEKLLSVYYNLENTEISWNIRSSFQLIEPMHSDKDAPINNGWVHQDYNNILAAICYLNPNPDPDSGTSFFLPKEKVTEMWKHDIMQECSLRFDAFSSFGKTYNVEEYNKTFTKHRSKFNEVVQVKNVYNRLIVFDANYWHAQNSLICNNEPRLTQVFFANSIETTAKSPYERIGNIL